MSPVSPPRWRGFRFTLGTKRKVISLAFHFDCKPAPSAPIPLAGFFGSNASKSVHPPATGNGYRWGHTSPPCLDTCDEANKLPQRGRWRTAYGTSYILARPDRWSRGGNWPCDHWDCLGGSFSAAEYSWCGRSGKRRSKSGKARRRCHREYAVLSPAGASGLSPLLPATRQALLQARTPAVLLLKPWSEEVSE